MLSPASRLIPALRRLASAGPGLCEVCRSWGTGALCERCRARYAPPQPRCTRCGLRLAQPAPACGACLREPPPWHRTVCVADYGYPWDGLIAAFKFEGRVELARTLAAQMVESWRAAALPPPACLVAVPLAPARLAERGYDQAWEL
ncbi:MAG: ComF family protein, partial [Burkholderiales bacterium]|nr:ComF family protein [Burkholderiales bacterium]